MSRLYGEKPVVTGTFTIESFRVMRDMQLAVRGGEKELREKPLTIFSCCPTSPLKWSEITSQNVVDCGTADIGRLLVFLLSHNRARKGLKR